MCGKKQTRLSNSNCFVSVFRTGRFRGKPSWPKNNRITQSIPPIRTPRSHPLPLENISSATSQRLVRSPRLKPTARSLGRPMSVRFPAAMDLAQESLWHFYTTSFLCNVTMTNLPLWSRCTKERERCVEKRAVVLNELVYAFPVGRGNATDLVLCEAAIVTGYEPATGEQRWRLTDMSIAFTASPTGSFLVAAVL